MTARNDPIVRLEAWLLDEDESGLPVAVLDAVVAELSSVRQVRARGVALRLNRAIVFGLLAAVLVVGTLIGAAVLAPPPAPSPIPDASASPSASARATPSASTEPTPAEAQIILGYADIPALAGMQADLRGWSPAPPPDPVGDGLYDAGYCEGPSCGLHEIYHHDPTRTATAFVYRDREGSALDRAVRFELLDPVADPDGLVTAAERLASESGDQRAAVSGPFDLPAGTAVLVEWTLSPSPYSSVAIRQYVILAEDRTILVTFGVPASEGSTDRTLAAVGAVIDSLRVTGSNLRLGVETYGPVDLDLTGWSLPPDSGLSLAILAAESGGELPGAWQLVSATRTDTSMLRRGLIGIFPSGAYTDPKSIVLIRDVSPTAEGLDATALAEAAAARGGNGHVVRAIQLPAGPARIVRSSFETSAHAVIEVMTYVILTDRGYVVLEFGSRQLAFAEMKAEFQRVAESVRQTSP